MSLGNHGCCNIDTSGLTRSERKLIEELCNDKNNHKHEHPCHDKPKCPETKPKCDDKNKDKCWDGKVADYVVIGVGAAGSMVTRLLSNDFKTSVIAIDRGSWLGDDPVVVDNVNLAAPWRRPKNDDIYEINEQGQPNGLLGNYNLELGKGGPGGSTVHYFGNATRGTQWDEVAQILNDPSWSYNNMLPIFKAIEDYIGLTEAPAQRGNNGPLTILQNGNPVGNALVNGMATAYDIPAVLDYNLNIGNAVSASQRLVKLTPDGRRVRVWGYDLLPQSIVNNDGYAVDGRKLRIYFNATADKIHFEDRCDPNRGTHVSFVSYDAKVTKVEAKKAIIVAGGPIGTPGVLQRSGIGPADVLRAAGVEPKIPNEHVGRHFKTHLGLTTPYAAAGFPVNNFPGPIQNQGVMAFDDGHTVGYPKDNVRRYEHLFTGLGGLLPPVAAQLGIPLNAPNLNNWYLRPRSEGTVSIVSKDPQILPNIAPNILSDGGLDDPNSDATAMVRVAKEAQLLANALGTPLLFPTPATFAAGDNAILTAVRSGWTVSSHFVEYARMGTSEANSAVDSRLKVWNTPNIYVCDMGVSPIPVSGHTGVPAFAIGARMAQILGYPVAF